MSKENAQQKEKGWLAAEYALGVSQGSARQEAERLVERDIAFRRSVDAWQNQLSPMLDEVEPVTPPAALWQRIEKEIAPPEVAAANTGVGAGLWKLITAFSSTVAIACLGGLVYISGGDFTGGTIPDLKQRLAATQSNVSQANTAFEEARARSQELEQQLADAGNRLDAANAELADANAQVADARAEVAALNEQFASTKPLVASLTQSGDAPAFVAQYDPIKKALLIRTAVEDTDEKVPEIWLIPAEGDRKGEVLSLGVMNENAPDEVRITDEFVDLIGEGGTLAITMEPPGGSPTGVATGPVIALGKLQAF